MYEALSRLPKLVKLELLEFEISPPSEKEQKTKIHSLPKVTDLTIVQVHRFLSFKGFIKNGQFRADKYLQMILQRFPAVTSLTIMCRTFFPGIRKRLARSGSRHTNHQMPSVFEWTCQGLRQKVCQKVELYSFAASFPQ